MNGKNLLKPEELVNILKKYNLKIREFRWDEI